MISKIKKGFSLVELLVVIAIIGILAAVGITAYQGYTQAAKERAALAQHSQVVKLINSEFAQCAGGEGAYEWGLNDAVRAEVQTAIDAFAATFTKYTEEQAAVLKADLETTTFEPLEAYCYEDADPAQIVTHINGTATGQLGMKNSYDQDDNFAEEASGDGEDVTKIGRTKIFCDGEHCQVRTMYKAGELNQAGNYEQTNIQTY